MYAAAQALGVNLPMCKETFLAQTSDDDVYVALACLGVGNYAGAPIDWAFVRAIWTATYSSQSLPTVPDEYNRLLAWLRSNARIATHTSRPGMWLALSPR
jgi:hypothetical protein